ncbi:prepilin-type N-terminal cleavage/methylation domain-containing protein [Kordia zhangzhouensis]|uniref:prepilin-type N-terminal cleavage/methylation domain-containing protein n=1 Tax=Kordia zhangzhouensis TaxID=1620405 RepID=UPI00062990FD|nr:prepilin-type N-terminal cleavage/methylation domain-containing protein [Kordia zhangzhouensis]
MNNRKHTIRAFTLSELVIVILITVIVAGIAFSVLELVQKQMSGIQTNFKNTTSISLLEQSLYIDMHRSNQVQYDKLNNTLVFTSEIDTVRYQIEKDFVHKEIDTFALSIEKIQLYFEGKETTADKIDAFKLTTAKEYKNAAIFIYKRNTANTYMNP